jgi:hypothetical protein
MKTKRSSAGTRRQNVAVVPLIRGLLPTLKRAHRRIAEVVLSDPEQFIAQTISELAKSCGVSAGSIGFFPSHWG